MHQVSAFPGTGWDFVIRDHIMVPLCAENDVGIHVQGSRQIECGHEPFDFVHCGFETCSFQAGRVLLAEPAH